MVDEGLVQKISDQNNHLQTLQDANNNLAAVNFYIDLRLIN